MNKEILNKLSDKRLNKVGASDLEQAKKIFTQVIEELSALQTIEEKLTKLDEKYGFLENSLMHLTAKFGDELSTATILDLISESPEAMQSVVNTRNRELFTAMHYAAHSGNSMLAEALLAGGAENNPQASIEHRLWTPIHYAAKFGYTEIVEILINSGVDKETKTGFGLTPLLVGAEFGKVNVVKLMLKLGADKDAQTIADNHHMNALDYAAVGNFKDLAITLLQAGINRNHKTNNDLTALDFAIQSDHGEIVSLLISWGIGNLDYALQIANENKSLNSLESIKSYLAIRKNLFDKKWLQNNAQELIASLKNCSRENLGLINIFPALEPGFNAYGILNLKRQTGLFSKKDESLIEFCIDNKLIDLASVLRAIEALAK